MKFKEIIEDLKREEDIKGRILLARCGVFIVAIGNDAILLHDICGLKLTCFGYKVCKVSMPAVHVYKYLDIIEKNNYAYAVYDYEKESKKLTLKIEYEGKRNEITETTMECEKCSYFIKNNAEDKIDVFEFFKKRKKEKNKKKIEEETKYEQTRIDTDTKI